MPEDQCVRAMRAIKAIIESIPADLWEEAQERDDPLWQRLDDIDAIALGSLQEVQHNDGDGCPTCGQPSAEEMSRIDGSDG